MAVKRIASSLFVVLLLSLLASCESPVAAIVPVTGIALNKQVTSLVIGETETLTATIAPANATDKGVSWESADPSIADADGAGNVTGIAAGSTTIRASADDGAFVAECEVWVVAIPVDDVTLEPSNITLNVGNSYQLVATVAPSYATNQNLAWSSSQPSVAIALANEPGKVVALAQGTTEITVSTQDGNKTATCTVTVVP